MAINEIYPNPTVKKVIFQIKFPNLFYIENKIGEIQLKIMEEFPQSSLIYRQQIVFADVGSDGKMAKVPKEFEDDNRKIWRFESEKGFQLNILSNSLDITSEYHKTYNLEGGKKFRDIIKFVLDIFFEITKVPVINRIGLRYIDECPLPSKDNATFNEYYNSVLPIERFNIEKMEETVFRSVIKKQEYYLGYVEALKEINNDYKLILDFDGYAKDIKSEDYLEVTDALHDIIIEEFEKTIKGPVIDYMQKKGD